MLKRVAVLLGIFLSVGAVSAQAAEKLFYRYVDASNKVVILDRLPPDAPAVQPPRTAGGKLVVVIAPGHDVLRKRERRLEQRLPR